MTTQKASFLANDSYLQFEKEPNNILFKKLKVKKGKKKSKPKNKKKSSKSWIIYLYNEEEEEDKHQLLMNDIFICQLKSDSL